MTTRITGYCCSHCRSTHTGYEWNRNTAVQIKGPEWEALVAKGYASITPIETGDGNRSAHGNFDSHCFYYCPSCQQESYSHTVREELAALTNSNSVFLLSKVMPRE